jgi:ESCRT-I complex subunit TSG101
MEGPPTAVQLEALLAPLRYSDKARVARDVVALLRNTNSLQIKIGQFVHANGSSDTLLSLTGTIPIDYKGGTYNIPVTLWLGDAYPLRPPSCFVTPTRDMRIKDGHLHVDHFGVVYLPYLNQWAPHQSNLIEMVTIMSSVFSQDPPVFRVPAQPAQSPQQQQQQHAQYQQQQLQQQQQQQQRQPQQYVNPYAQQQPQQSPQQQSQPSPAAQSSQSVSPANAAVSSASASPAPSVQVQDPRATKKNMLLAQLTLRMRAHLADELSAKTLLLDDLLSTQAQVEAHGAAVAAEAASLQAQLARVREAQRVVLTQNEELNKWLQQNEKRELPSVDQLCYPKDTWSKQSVRMPRCHEWPRVCLLLTCAMDSS